MTGGDEVFGGEAAALDVVDVHAGEAAPSELDQHSRHLAAQQSLADSVVELQRHDDDTVESVGDRQRDQVVVPHRERRLVIHDHLERLVLQRIEHALQACRIRRVGRQRGDDTDPPDALACPGVGLGAGDEAELIDDGQDALTASSL